jgi:asparaginyl-tRNA synthetase
VGGWVRTIRIQGGGKFAFVELNDGSTVKHLQIVITNEIKEFNLLKDQGIGSSMLFKGIVVKSKGQKQSVRIYF